MTMEVFCLICFWRRKMEESTSEGFALASIVNALFCKARNVKLSVLACFQHYTGCPAPCRYISFFVLFFNVNWPFWGKYNVNRGKSWLNIILSVSFNGLQRTIFQSRILLYTWRFKRWCETAFWLSQRTMFILVLPRSILYYPYNQV